MAHVIESNKGYKVIHTNIHETMKWGGVGICDHCNGGDVVGMFVAVLNHWVCRKCYKLWHDDAVFYPEDIPFEDRMFNRYCNILGIDSEMKPVKDIPLS